MKVIRSIPAASQRCAQGPHPVILVPTMGALHRGHIALLKLARQHAGPDGTVVASIFVNPTQFGPKEDFSRYPRPFAADRKICQDHGVDVLFAPSPEAMYPEGFSTYVEEEKVSQHLCGASRPGHFRGVCTVVSKLFGILRPDSAVFGLKDFQQCAVLRRMVCDLNLRVKLITMPTVREPDGLALSSRNQYLTNDERAQAPVLSRALQVARQAVQKGETSTARVRQLMNKTLAQASLARLDYLQIAHADTLQPVSRIEKNTVIALAVFFGKTRLIDNLWLK